MTSTPPEFPVEDEMIVLDMCFATGGACQWRALPVPAVCAWRECGGCGRVQYRSRSRSGWSELLSDRAHLHWRVLRLLWRRNCWEWEVKVHPVFRERENRYWAHQIEGQPRMTGHA